MSDYIKRLIHKIKKHRQCKRMGYWCPDCIYHNFILDNANVFRGNDCLFDKRGETDGERRGARA